MIPAITNHVNLTNADIPTLHDTSDKYFLNIIKELMTGIKILPHQIYEVMTAK
jgi:hypothetical protein